MNILVINGSPRKNGNTTRMVDAFTKGATEKGHTVQVLSVAGKKLSGCVGCYHCMQSGGICAQKDDMEEFYTAYDKAEMMVWASPIYWYDITAQLKIVIDRLFAKAMTGTKPAKMALLLDSQGKNPFTAAKRMYKDSCNALKAQDMGVVTVEGTKLDAKETADELFTKAYELGKSL